MGEKTGGHLTGEADEGTGSPEPQSCGVRVQSGALEGRRGWPEGASWGCCLEG